MTVSSNLNRNDHIITAGTTVYPFAFRIFEDADLVVTVRNTLGVEEKLTLVKDYTVSGTGNHNGGSIALAGSAVIDNIGSTITIRRVLEVTQETSIREQGAAFLEIQEGVLDRLAMIDQQQQEELNRSIKLPETVSIGGIDVTLPVPKPMLAIGWSPDGKSLQNHDAGISVLDFGADPTGTADSTAAFNRAAATGKRVFIPAGVYLIDPRVGFLVRQAGAVGEGYMKSLLFALPYGETPANLANFVGGSVVKRHGFTPGVANEYMQGAYLADFAVILNHPTYDASNYRQIAVDLRNMTRSTVERVYVGNTTVTGMPLRHTPPVPDMIQGYGFVLGTQSTSCPDYCGGECNVLNDVFAWGAFKNIVVDDTAISPLSGAHATQINNPDVQFGHELITQGTRYGAGLVIRDAIVQAVTRQTGNVSPTIALSLAGYNGHASIKYAELGADCDIMLGMAFTATDNTAEITYWSTTGGAFAVTDIGSRNQITYRESLAISGAYVSQGRLTELYNRAPRRVYAKFAWDGISAFTFFDSSGVANVTRTDVGDYTILLHKDMPSSHWIAHINIDTNASGHAACVTIVYNSQGPSTLRFYCYAQNGDVTTLIDPRMVYFTGSQP